MKSAHTTQPTDAAATQPDQMREGMSGNVIATTDALADGLVEGVIVEGSRGRYRVQTAAGDLLYVIRGKLRKALTYAENAESAQARNWVGASWRCWGHRAGVSRACSTPWSLG